MIEVILTTIAITTTLLWLIGKLINSIFNIKALRRKDVERHKGLIYNTKTAKLEGASDKVTPF